MKKNALVKVIVLSACMLLTSCCHGFCVKKALQDAKIIKIEEYSKRNQGLKIKVRVYTNELPNQYPS